jgi:hypothetical protein
LGAGSAFCGLLLAEQLGDIVLDRLGPALVTLGGEVQVVGHDVLGQLAVVVEEGRGDVLVEDLLVIGVALDDLVDRDVQLAVRVVGGLAAGEDAEQEDLGLGAFLLDAVDDRLDARGGVLGLVLAMAGVVGADHDDDQVGRQSVEVAVIETPQHVLGAIAADAEVGGVARGVKLLPHLAPGAFPRLGDRITDEDELGLALLGDFVEAVVALLRAIVELGRGRLDLGLAWLGHGGGVLLVAGLLGGFGVLSQGGERNRERSSGGDKQASGLHEHPFEPRAGGCAR